MKKRPVSHELFEIRGQSDRMDGALPAASPPPTLVPMERFIGRTSGWQVDAAIVASGTVLGVVLALQLEGMDLASIAGFLEAVLLPPLIALANAGISCF